MSTNRLRFLLIFPVLGCLVLSAGSSGFSGEGKPPQEKNPAIKDLNTPRDFPKIASQKEWQARAKGIREHILVSCGLWPLPEKAPLHAKIFGKIERDGYSIEKVYFQTFPGFYLAGNLYRPLGHGKGPFPAVLNPHGHWKEGRMADTKDGSIAARCISFARQGMIAFSYDMVGFNDSHFAGIQSDKPYYNTHREFGAAKNDQLWDISLMGLQTWNSIRALDFLESLPDADRKRLACTGESGGGTQTFMLGAIEDRLAVQAPVVMVSHTMQGGCSCENAPGLRVDYSNMEIAATPAPRPQILVAATGDWTKDTLTVEGPSVQHMYELFNAPDKLRYVRFDFGHNYNQTSREAVYEWFGKWLLKHPNPSSLKEKAYTKEPDADLRVFPDGQLPKDAMTREQFTEALKTLYRARWQSLVPQSMSSVEKYKQVMLPAWRHTLQTERPHRAAKAQCVVSGDSQGFTTATLNIKRLDEETTFQANYWGPARIVGSPSPKLVVLSDSEAGSTEGNRITGLPLQLLQQGVAVLLISQPAATEAPDQFANFYTTYNRTRVQKRVRDLVTACASASSADPRKSLSFRVILFGRGHAGLWSLLAAPGADAVIADCEELDTQDEQALLGPDLFCPGIHNIGGFQGVAMLATPHPLLLHNIGAKFPVDALQSTYKAAGATGKLRVEPKRLSDDELVQWVAQIR